MVENEKDLNSGTCLCSGNVFMRNVFLVGVSTESIPFIGDTSLSPDGDGDGRGARRSPVVSVAHQLHCLVRGVLCFLEVTLFVDALLSLRPSRRWERCLQRSHSLGEQTRKEEEENVNIYRDIDNGRPSPAIAAALPG